MRDSFHGGKSPGAICHFTTSPGFKYLRTRWEIDGQLRVGLRDSALADVKETADVELVDELAAMQELHQFTARLLSAESLADAMREVLHIAIDMQKADFGNIQVLNAENGMLEIVAQQ